MYPSPELSPYGSLTNKTLTSMIESIYEKSTHVSSASLASMGSSVPSGDSRHPAAIIGEGNARFIL